MNMFLPMAKETAVTDLEVGRLFSYLGGPNAINSVLLKGYWKCPSQK